jgi:hypothetical protein
MGSSKPTGLDDCSGWTIPHHSSIDVHDIVYEPPMDTSACGIEWKTCTMDRWDLDRPYDAVAKGCHTWHIRGCTYVLLVRFIPLQGLFTDSNLHDTLAYEW